MDPLSGGQVQPVQVCAVYVPRCSAKYVEKAVYDDHRLDQGDDKLFNRDQYAAQIVKVGSYLSVDSVGLLPATVKQGPSLVFHVANVNVVAVVLPEGDPRTAKHQQIVTVQHGCSEETVLNVDMLIFFFFPKYKNLTP